MSKIETLKMLLDLIKDEHPQYPEALNEKPFAYEMLGKNVIIRTYSAGVWFGLLDQKAKNEVILKNARRLWYWKTKKGISLSSVALYGIDDSESKIAPAVDSVWLEAIEIIPTTKDSSLSIEEAKNAST
jgi:hypothetical protein